MIQAQVKLKLKNKQNQELESWLLVLFRVWNWAIRKIELDGKDGIYYSKLKFVNLLANHSKKIGIPSHTIQGMLESAWTAWSRCFKKVAKKPKLKGARNKLHSIPFPDPVQYPKDYRIKLPKIGLVKYHKQKIPQGRIKCGRLIKKASGWYFCLFIDAQANSIPKKADKVIGIDPGLKTHLMTTDEDVNITICDLKRNRFSQIKKRLEQAQRGKRKKLVARLFERLKNRRKDDNHKLSRKLVEQCQTICFSKDRIQAIKKKPKPQKKKNGKYKRSIRLGRSVSEAGHYQLRQMISYKCTASGRTFKEVESKYSTMTCSNCLAKSGPAGKAGLSVRQWECIECGSLHDRDRNAAINTLVAGLGTSLEGVA